MIFKVLKQSLHKTRPVDAEGLLEEAAVILRLPSLYNRYRSVSGEAVVFLRLNLPQEMTSWDGRQHSFETTLSLVIKAVCYHPQRMSWDWPVLKLFSRSYLVTYLWKWYKEKTKLNVNGITWKIPNFFCGAALSAVIWTEWKCVCKGSRTIRSLQKGSCVGNSSWSVCLIQPFTTFHLIWQRTRRGGSKRAVFVTLDEFMNLPLF